MKSRGSSASRATRRNGRLSRLDWLEAGQAILCERGIADLKLAALTKRLHVSTGSFYHHFPDFDAYLTAVARHFSAEKVWDTLRQAEADDADPLVRLQRLRNISRQTHLFQLDQAMRVWAATDRRAIAAVRAAERIVLAFLVQAFRDLGFDPDAASLRARLLLSANVARIEATAPSSRPHFFRGALRLLSRDAPRRPRRVVRRGG